MADDTLTIVLTGEVPLREFAKAVNGFMRLIDGLRETVVGGADLDWVITELEAGSAITTVRGRPIQGDDYAPLHKLVRAYEVVTDSFRQGVEPQDFSPAVINPVRDILSVVDGRILSVRFETEESEAEITPESIARLEKPSRGVVVAKPPAGAASRAMGRFADAYRP